MDLSLIHAHSAAAAKVAVGQAAAAAMIAARANDGSSPLEFFLPTSSNPGVWQLTPGCPAAGGVFFNWQNDVAIIGDFSQWFWPTGAVSG